MISGSTGLDNDMKRLMKIDNKVKYIVGYKKPPKSTRFEKGKSGNPNGRPKGSRNKKPKVCTTFRSLIIDAANEVVESHEGNEVIDLTVAQAIVKSLGQSAMEGNSRSQVLFLKMLQQAERDEMDDLSENIEMARRYKEKSASLLTEDGRHLSEEDPEYLPHPDHIKINKRTGDVTFSGPVDEEDKKAWEDLWHHKNILEERLDKLKEDQRGNKIESSKAKKILEITNQLEFVEQTIAMRWDVDLFDLVSDPDRRKVIRHRIDNKIVPPGYAH